MTNWEREGFPSKQVYDQIQVIADPKSGPDIRITLLTALKTELDGYDLAPSADHGDKKPAAKRGRWKSPKLSFLMYMKPQEETPKLPMTMLGAPPKEKFPFKISYKLPYISFPIGDGRTSEDTATLTGLLDTGGCCNMGWLQYHKAIAAAFPQFVEKLICLDEERYETINIGGLKEGVTITHMIQYAIPFTEKGEQCYLTLGLTEDLPIDTLYGLGFQVDAKMKIDFASKKVESALLQASFPLTFKEPRRTNPDHVRSEERNTPKSLLTTDE